MKKLVELPQDRKARYASMPVYTGRAKRKIPHPDIKFVHSDTVTAFYHSDGNCIAIHGDKNTNEDFIVMALLHELDHWANSMYLPRDIYQAYVKRGFIYSYECPFVEYINSFPGYYDFNKWEEIYHRNVKRCETPLKKIRNS